MIVKNKKNPINGSSALAPEYVPEKHKKQQSNKQNGKNKKVQINKQKTRKLKAKVLRNILLGFALAITLIYRYCLIYDMEKTAMDVKKQISSVNAENENLKIGLLKYNNIQLIEKTATEELNMIPKSKTNVVYVDLNKENFKDVTSVQKEKEEGNDFIGKVKKILF